MEALANKYRPKSFIDVSGQNAVINVLHNQIEKGSVARAYLMTGPAGCGKTTIARILASKVDAEVIEIDGASNNGVDNIREIIERVQFKPMTKDKIVVIIDEVHMLSTGAFNALLKTLEEPPSHCIFILATTDPQKIPATILSRVQRFNFNRMTVLQIIERVQRIAFAEGIEIEQEAIEYIAKLAQGGMRAAISMLDTCRGFLQEGEEIKEADVVNILGQSSYDELLRLFEAVVNQMPKETIEVIENVYRQGKDLKLFMKSFAEFLVDVNKYLITGDLSFTLIPSAYQEKVDSFGTVPELMTWFEKVNSLNNHIKYDHNPKNTVIGELLCL